MSYLEILLFLLAIVGHIGIWCGLFNQIHATNLPRWVRKCAEKSVYILVAALLLLLCWRAVADVGSFAGILKVYEYLCLFGLAYLLGRWVWLILMFRQPAEINLLNRQSVNIGSQLMGPAFAGFQARFLGAIPLNQVLQISVERQSVHMQNWPDELDGMVIAHLTDLHFTGKVCKEYFQQVVQECNRLMPDFVFVTGDIVDKVECIAWLSETLGNLTSKHGKYYVLGNHDRRVKDEAQLRDAIQATGFSRATGEWQELRFEGASFFVAGDELPWYPGAENLTKASGPSILLAHSPDRIYASADLGVDLILAGHCHGGQIRIPFIGPIIAPSKYGIRFASGSFKIKQTLMRVSRGISGDDPIRLNCPPELSILDIRTREQAR